jgi:hypothetical protein
MDSKRDEQGLIAKPRTKNWRWQIVVENKRTRTVDVRVEEAAQWSGTPPSSSGSRPPPSPSRRCPRTPETGVTDFGNPGLQAREVHIFTAQGLPVLGAKRHRTGDARLNPNAVREVYRAWNLGFRGGDMLTDRNTMEHAGSAKLNASAHPRSACPAPYAVRKSALPHNRREEIAKERDHNPGTGGDGVYTSTMYRSL